MAFKLLTKGGDLLHAYCLLGDCTQIKNELLEYLEKEFSLVTKGNPDVWCGDYDVLGVDESRMIKESHMILPTQSDKKYFIISANFITESAQNAMLKMFEEPSGHTHIFLVSPTSKNLLPTLKSRLNIVNMGEKQTQDESTFIYLAIKDRLKIVKDIMQKITDEEESKMSVISFINSLEEELMKFDIKENAIWLERLEKLRMYAMDQSPSLKMLLEHISLTLPVFKKIKR